MPEEEVEIKIESEIEKKDYSTQRDVKEKKVEKVVKSQVKRKKKTTGQKLEEAFIGESPQNVKSYLVWDILIPAVKDTISDLVKKGIDALLFSEGRPSNASDRGGGTSRIRYDQASYRQYQSPGRRTSPGYTYNRRAGHNFDDIIFRTRADAENVLDNLVELTMQYGIATVGDLYSMAGIDSTYVDQEYGWYELSRAAVLSVRGGFILDLPKPQRIEDDW